jgi:hypothetical protein
MGAGYLLLCFVFVRPRFSLRHLTLLLRHVSHTDIISRRYRGPSISLPRKAPSPLTYSMHSGQEVLPVQDVAVLSEDKESLALALESITTMVMPIIILRRPLERQT